MQDLDVKDIPFWMPVSRGAILDDSGETGLRLLNVGDASISHIEIPTEVLLSYTNCTRPDWAASLLEIAAAAGALSILVFSNDFWKNGPRGIPVIDTQALLANIPSPTGLEVETR